jgi:hypothetical protein
LSAGIRRRRQHCLETSEGGALQYYHLHNEAARKRDRATHRIAR